MEQTPNYLLILAGYFQHGIEPIKEKWIKWTNYQRGLLLLFLVPLVLFPALFTAFIVFPWLVIFIGIGYVWYFGYETGKNHLFEAFGEKAKRSMQELRQMANESPKLNAILLFTIENGAIAVNRTLSIFMTFLEFLINSLVGISRSVKVHKKKFESQSSSSIKRISGGKPIIPID